MKFLIDTNIVIPLEPASIFDLEINTEVASEFIRLCNLSHNELYIHPEIRIDIGKDKNVDRRSLRSTLIKKYSPLQSPPPPSILDQLTIPPAPEHTNAWVDNCLLAALQSDLVDYLVTEDIGIHKKAKLLNLGARVLLLNDANELLRDLFDTTPAPPPTVSTEFVYQIDTNDPIFDSLRADYGGAQFDQWLGKCKKEHRQAFVVRSTNDYLAGVLIWKREDALPDGRKGKVLKICTFKVSDKHGGNRIGELLLKPLFDLIEANGYQHTYFTAYPKQTQLIGFAYDFGFSEIENKVSPNELALCKTFSYTEIDRDELQPLEFHVQFGPRVTSFSGNKSFILPIRPNYHLILFPEIGPKQVSIIPPQPKPCGNAIRKAYICNSSITKISPGDNLFFYRSNDIKAITCIGIVEDVFRSQDPSEIARFVGKRTVYPYNEIAELCKLNPALAILFRLVKPFKEHIHLQTLRKNDIIQGQPQSISELNGKAISWLRQRIGM